MSDGGWGAIMPKAQLIYDLDSLEEKEALWQSVIRDCPHGVVLTFDLDEEFGLEYFVYAHTGLDVRLAVSAFAEKLRQMVKYAPDDYPSDKLDGLQQARDLLWQIFEEHEVDWEVF
jgi:hypothetical protein